MSDEDTRKRKISALVALNKYKLMKRNIIVTLDEDNTLTMGNIEIQIVPVWKWLIESEQNI